MDDLKPDKKECVRQPEAGEHARRTAMARLRQAMREQRVDIAIIPQADPHQSEYIADQWQVIKRLTGFTGSAATLVVTQQRAALWTDSRYYLQAEAQLRGSGIEFMPEGLVTTMPLIDWVVNNSSYDMRVGLATGLISVSEYESKAAELIKFRLRPVPFSAVQCALDVIPPKKPNVKVSIYDEKFAGKSARAKLREVRERIPDGVDGLLVSTLDDIAWLLNLRGRGYVKYNPVFPAYIYVPKDSKHEAVLYSDEAQYDNQIVHYLKVEGVTVASYSDIELLPQHVKTIMFDPDKTTMEIAQMFHNRYAGVRDTVALLKSQKNPAEVEGFRDAMRRDGAALAKAFMEIEKRVYGGENITEIEVADILHKYRSQDPFFVEESFATIAGFGPHGAIVHYCANESTNATIESRGLLLVDSGAQYLDATTDITRTISLGEPTAAERRDFTLVLKGMIALARAIFPEGTRGVQLEVLAKQFLWGAGQQYMHGTGHGVGHFLNVHEGPQTIRNNNNLTPLLIGMVTSDEPGLYKAGNYGIRCENLLLTTYSELPQHDGVAYYCFETLTLFPFDTKLIDREMFTEEETAWLNSYHRRVREELSSLVDDETRRWIESKTEAI